MLLIPASHSDHLEALGQLSLVGQVVERRQELAVGQIAGRAEDHQGGRMDRQALQALDERVLDVGQVQRRGGTHSFGAVLTACPPNWLRSAATVRAE